MDIDPKQAQQIADDFHALIAKASDSFDATEVRGLIVTANQTVANLQVITANFVGISERLKTLVTVNK